MMGPHDGAPWRRSTSCTSLTSGLSRRTKSNRCWNRPGAWWPWKETLLGSSPACSGPTQASRLTT